MIRFFKSKYSFQPVIVVVFAVMLCFDAFYNPPPRTFCQFTLPFLNDFFNSVARFPTIAVFLGFCLLLLNAFIFNTIIVGNNIMGKYTYMPALIYILLMSLFKSNIILNNFSVVNLFILLIIRLLFKIYDKSDSYQQVLNIGFLLALISFFYFPGILLILFIWLVFIQFNIFSWREWTIIWIGLLIPYIFLSFFYFWFDNFYALLDIARLYYKSFYFHFHYTIYQVIFGSVLAFIVFVCLIYTMNGLERNTVIIRKKFILFISLAVISLVAGSVYSQSSNSLSVFLLPSALFASNYFQTVKKKFWRETIFILLLLLFVYSRIFI